MENVLEGVLRDARLQTLLALIVLDVVLGIAAALRTGTFAWAEVGRFYRTTVVPIFLGYGALRATLPFISQELLGAPDTVATEAMASAFWLAGVGTLLSSIARSVAALGVSQSRDTTLRG